jgi:hypothetical protein
MLANHRLEQGVGGDAAGAFGILLDAEHDLAANLVHRLLVEAGFVYCQLQQLEGFVLVAAQRLE